MASPRICLLNPYPPSLSPRLVRNANALAKAGYGVIVVTTRFPKRLWPHGQVCPDVPWRHEFVDMADSVAGKLRWQFARVRRRLCLVLATHIPGRVLVNRACTYAGPELARLAASYRASLYISHTHGALPACACAARRVGARLAFDAEDMLAESSAEPLRVMQSIENQYVPACDLVTTMSRAAALRLQERLALPREPMVLHNTPSLRERDGVPAPDARTSNDVLRIYWFGQTIGRHSCADQVLRALPLVSGKARLILRGTADAAYVQELRSLAARLGLKDALEIQPRALPTEMVRLAAEHDVALGSQPSSESFHQMAVGNKVFTGLMAGLALALTDTVAHRRLIQELGPCAFLFPNNDHVTLARQLDELACSPEKLRAMKSAAWRLAQERFNWELESRSLVETVSALVKSPRE